MKKRKWLSLLLAVMMLVSAVPFFPVTADAADGTVEVSTWAELKKALDYTTNCSVVKVVKDIETKSLNGHTGLHQDNIIFMSMAIYAHTMVRMLMQKLDDCQIAISESPDATAEWCKTHLPGVP